MRPLHVLACFAVGASLAVTPAHADDHVDRAVRPSSGDRLLRETLFVLAPSFEAAKDRVFFRLEAVLGLGESLRSYGGGIYPLVFQLALGRRVNAFTDSSNKGSVVTVRAASATAAVDHMTTREEAE